MAGGFFLDFWTINKWNPEKALELFFCFRTTINYAMCINSSLLGLHVSLFRGTLATSHEMKYTTHKMALLEPEDAYLEKNKKFTFTKHAFLDTFLVAFFFWFWSESWWIILLHSPREMHHHFTHDFQHKSLLAISWQREELQEAVSCISFLDCSKSLASCGVCYI